MVPAHGHHSVVTPQPFSCVSGSCQHRLELHQLLAAGSGSQWQEIEISPSLIIFMTLKFQYSNTSVISCGGPYMRFNLWLGYLDTDDWSC